MSRCTLLLLLLLLLGCQSLNAQNLVENYSFEDFEECPEEVTVYSEKH